MQGTIKRVWLGYRPRIGSREIGRLFHDWGLGCGALCQINGRLRNYLLFRPPEIRGLRGAYG